MNEKTLQLYTMFNLEVGKEYHVVDKTTNGQIGKVKVNCESIYWSDNLFTQSKRGHPISVNTLLSYRFKEIKREYSTEEIMAMEPTKIQSCVTSNVFDKYRNPYNSTWYSGKFDNKFTTTELLGKWTIEEN